MSIQLSEDKRRAMTRAEAKKNAYNKFFEEHDAKGELQISEIEAVRKLKNFGISAGVDRQKRKWIVLDGKSPVNSIILGLCKHLQKNYNYNYWNKNK
jgi:hypothetical protein